MKLNDVHQGIHKNKKRKRIGRGPGSGHGKTSGRGHKGYYSRAGSSRRLSFEGGQMPLARRIAKRGFSNAKFAAVVKIVNLSQLDSTFEDGDVVSVESLTEKGVIKGKFDKIKVLGNGELSKKLTIQVHAISSSAKDKVSKAGGTVELLS